MLNTLRLGFVGAGSMARAIGFPLIQRGILKPSQVIASSPEESFLFPWEKLGCSTTPDNGKVIGTSDAVIWAVKPQIFPKAVEATTVASVPGHLSTKFHISIMAGLPLDFFTETLTQHFSKMAGPKELRTARVMPNVGLTVNAGCSVYTMGKHSKEEDKTALAEIFGTSGLCYEVPESQINAYCGLFGSGIGFMFVVLEAMSDGAVKMGIPRDLSLKIAAQTMKGASEVYLSDVSVHPGTLKDSVCSPGGTTIAGVAEMEKRGVRSGIIGAIEAATLRGEELGRRGTSGS